MVLSPPHLTMSEFFARTIQSKKMMEEAEQVLPNGVTANIKFFDPYPIVMKFGNGPYLTDVDGNLYIDYSLSYGALMCGHGHPRIKEAIIKQMEKDGTNLFGTPHEMETSLGKRIQSYYPSMERIRYTNSGTEGTLLAIRLASSFTEKSAIAKFEGHYHGGYDQVLFSINPDRNEMGPDWEPHAVPESKGIDPFYQKNMVILPFNDLEHTEKLLRKYQDKIAAVIMEPTLGGYIPATKEFMHGLRKITEELGIVLIFDEVKSGFRMGIGGAQQYYDVKPDLTILGKVIGGGFPFGIVGGKKEIMMESAPRQQSDVFDPSQSKRSKAQDVLFHSGTYNGHPTILAVAHAVLDILEETGDRALIFSEKLKTSLEELFKQKGIPMQALGLGTIFNIVLTEHKVNSYRDLQNTNLALRKQIDYHLLAEGIYNKPLNRYNVSVVHGERELEKTLDAYQKVLFQKI